MGSIKKKIDESADWTDVKATGTLGMQELMEFMAEIYSGNVTTRILLDFREADISVVSSDELMDIAKAVSEKLAGAPQGRSAIVVSSDPEYGIGRMFESYAQIAKIGREYRSFRDMSEARAWLDEIESPT